FAPGVGQGVDTGGEVVQDLALVTPEQPPGQDDVDGGEQVRQQRQQDERDQGGDPRDHQGGDALDLHETVDLEAPIGGAGDGERDDEQQERLGEDEEGQPAGDETPQGVQCQVGDAAPGVLVDQQAAPHRLVTLR